jgi:tetratricopeptide (TPR) repeat protein
MSRLILFLFLIILNSCDNHKESKAPANDTVEILNRNEENDLEFFYGSDSFDMEETRKLNNIGIQHIKKNEYKKAEQYFIKAYRLEPQNPTVLNNLGNVYQEIGTHKMALEYYEEALRNSDSTYLKAASNMGGSYRSRKEFDKSEQILNYVISRTENEFEKTVAKYTLVKVYNDQSKCEKARELYLKIEPYLDKYSELKENREKIELEMENCVQQSI